MEKYCFGCNEPCGNESSKSNTEGACPCTDCIVKIICSSDGCDKWYEWHVNQNPEEN